MTVSVLLSRLVMYAVTLDHRPVHLRTREANLQPVLSFPTSVLK